jgi:hypothetical protein
MIIDSLSLNRQTNTIHYENFYIYYRKQLWETRDFNS